MCENSKQQRNNFSKKKIKRQLKYIEEKIKYYLKILDYNDKSELSTHKYTTKEIKEKIKILKKRKENYENMQKKLSDIKEKERSMDAGYFLTKRMSSVRAETVLFLLAYNSKRVINIVGIEKLIQEMSRLRGNNLVKDKALVS